MKYKVIKAFCDAKDNLYRYEIDHEYPRKGYSTNEKRVEELSSLSNMQHTPLIVAVEEVKPKAKSKTKEKE